MNVRRAVELAIQIADAVADAHAAGFVHGGLSPDSVVITAKGHAKIPAFELAAHGGFEQDGGDRRVRLHDYDSPEEARGQAPTSAPTSIRSAPSSTRCSRPGARCTAGRAAPSASNPHVPPELDDVVLKAVAPNPDSRYQSAATFAAELRSVARDPRRARRGRRRGRGATGAVDERRPHRRDGGVILRSSRRDLVVRVSASSGARCASAAQAGPVPG